MPTHTYFFHCLLPWRCYVSFTRDLVAFPVDGGQVQQGSPGLQVVAAAEALLVAVPYAVKPEVYPRVTVQVGG